MTSRSNIAFAILVAGLLSLGSADAVNVHESVVTPRTTGMNGGVTQSACTTPEEVWMLCSRQQANGMWVVEERQGDNTWMVVKLQATRPSLVSLDDLKR